MVSVYQDAKRRGIYLALFTDPEGIYQISWINWKKVNFCKLKTYLPNQLDKLEKSKFL